MMKLKKVISIVLFLFLILNLVSCAPEGVVETTQVGFFGGLWDGFILINALIGSIFDSSITLIAENNNGLSYYLGWVIGLVFAILTLLVSLIRLIASSD